MCGLNLGLRGCVLLVACVGEPIGNFFDYLNAPPSPFILYQFHVHFGFRFMHLFSDSAALNTNYVYNPIYKNTVNLFKKYVVITRIQFFVNLTRSGSIRPDPVKKLKGLIRSGLAKV